MRTFLFLGLAALCLRLGAAPVDTNLVRQVAVRFYLNSNPEKSSVTLLKIKPFYYKGEITRYTCVFENQDFLIVSADDATVPIFAYSRERTFSEDLPPAFAWWMEISYDQLVFSARSKALGNQETRPLWDEILNSTTATPKSNSAVSPLIASRWGQTRSNDQQCPAYNAQGPVSNPGCNCEKCTAGCVAVAMAQIMHFWQYPANGLNRTFDWCNMPDFLIKKNGGVVRTSYEAEYLAVSGLLADCGQTADLQYCASTCATGSTLTKAMNALTGNYGYSELVQHRYRWLTSNWKSKLKTSLDLGNPVLYAGQSDYAGHAFVCDGYEGSDFYHFNWGWNGSSDGYFYIAGHDGSPEIVWDGFQEALFFLQPGSQHTLVCNSCTDTVYLSNQVSEENPYNHQFPYILWSGISSLYNLNPMMNPLLPDFSDLVSIHGESHLKYDDITAGAIYANNLRIPDKVIVNLRAYEEIVLQNIETSAGAEFSASITACPLAEKAHQNFAVGEESGFSNQESLDLISSTSFTVWPNPARDWLDWEYYSVGSENIQLRMIDLQGHELICVNESLEGKGLHTARTSLDQIPSGLYFCELRSPGGIQVQKMVVSR
jgi:hypothetical protein